jgi:predicted ATPase
LQQLEDQALIERVIVQDNQGARVGYARSTSVWTPPDTNAPLVYRFRSTLVRDVIYRSMPFAERQALHGILARSLEFQIGNAQMSSDSAILALIKLHWLKWNELIAEHYSQSQSAKEAFIRYVRFHSQKIFSQAFVC